MLDEEEEFQEGLPQAPAIHVDRYGVPRLDVTVAPVWRQNWEYLVAYVHYGAMCFTFWALPAPLVLLFVCCLPYMFARATLFTTRGLLRTSPYYYGIWHTSIFIPFIIGILVEWPVIPHLSSSIYLAGSLFLIMAAIHHIAAHKDPGFIPFSEAPLLEGETDSSKFCRTCRVPRPLRSRHCRHCGRCVARMDHHCVWFDACIGQNNHFQFFVAMLLHQVTQVLVTYFQREYFSTFAAVRETPWWRYPLTIVEVSPVCGANFLFTTWMGFLMLLVLLVHVYLISFNITTAEAAKAVRRNNDKHNRGVLSNWLELMQVPPYAIDWSKQY